jgi:hypothetical protein
MWALSKQAAHPQTQARGLLQQLLSSPSTAAADRRCSELLRQQQRQRCYPAASTTTRTHLSHRICSPSAPNRWRDGSASRLTTIAPLLRAPTERKVPEIKCRMQKNC